MGWITAILSSGPARKALGVALAAITIALFLLNLRRAGERSGRLAERLSTSVEIHEIQRQGHNCAPKADPKLWLAILRSTFDGSDCRPTLAKHQGLVRGREKTKTLCSGSRFRLKKTI